jgi:putative transposase
MTGPRRKFTPEEKARIVLEILKEEKSISQLASEHGIHSNVLQRWKTEAIQNMHQLFVDNRKATTNMKNEYEQQINELYAEVGKLSVRRGSSPQTPDRSVSGLPADSGDFESRGSEGSPQHGSKIHARDGNRSDLSRP